MISNEEILIRLIFAAFLGGLVGFERERKDWAVGIRTHMLASVASALIMMVSSFGFSDILGSPNVMLDPSRVASSVIIGIGYLGAGIILVLKPGNIKGLTTASGLWATGGIGLAAGGGMYFAAGMTTLLALIILYGIQMLQNRFARKRFRHQITIAADSQAASHEAFEMLSAPEYSSREITILRKRKAYVVKSAIIIEKDKLPNLTEKIGKINGVRKIATK